ncbi:sialate O-acetylesterase [Spirosoma flavum]|uniref:Sialate O-acetylesterase n=1 Tax=Spirosoma flavum TaxID=2048557 RepID=A0ABW6ADT9_9BACT
MTSPFRWVWICLFQLAPFVALAQLTITSPVPRMVFQRNLANEAIVTVTGMAPKTATTVEARFVPLAVGQGSVTAWTSLRFLPNSSAFRGKVTVLAGWYRLDIRAKAGATLLAQTQVNRVGVGEVFVVAGQSNAYGGFQRVPSSVEDRVMCIDFRQDSLSEQLLPLQFSHITYGTNIGPSQPPHLYGILGDKLVQRLNVPVLFIGAALGGTTSDQWYQSASGNIGTTPGPSVYRRLGAALLHYVSRTGARAVLWHQGEGDINTNTQTYFNNIKYVIDKSRQQVGSKPLAWVVSRVSYISGQTNPSVIAAQNQLISTVSNVFAGPATDSLTGYDNRSDNVHLQGAGLFRFTNAWDQSLSSSFFQNAVPFMPTDSAALITSGYTLPLTRRPGETVAVASLRSDSHESDNQYTAQIVRVSDGAMVYESPPSTDNPILITLPFTLTNGQYRLRTRSTHPVILGTLGEPFTVNQDVSPSPLFLISRPPVSSGTADTIIRRLAYSYDYPAHSFYAMVQATGPVEVRLQRTDGGSFSDSGWNVAPPSSQAPDYESFSDFNYLRNYPPISGGVGGVEPGKYRLSVRRQGDTGEGLSYEMGLINGRNILYYPMEPIIGAIPPVLTVNEPVASVCLSGKLTIGITISDGPLNSGNIFSVRLSDVNGSFTNEITIGTSTTSSIPVTLSPSLPVGNKYRLRVVASNPAVASAPTQPLSVCAGGADLSMSMSISNRTPDTGEPITLTLIVTNSGPSDAANVKVQSLLPAGIDFIDATSAAISATANTVNINAGTLPNGVSQPFAFRVKTSKPGVFATSAQITASSQFDPDSQPNSGTGDGQDDEATVDLRTPNASGPIIASPNPGQVPLPTVQSNQPTTDPTKADLSLAISTSSLVVTPGQVVSVTLTVSNRGGATANNVTPQTLLPTQWQLASTTGLTVSGQTVTGNIGSIASGTTGSLVLSVRVPGAGTLRSQIASATPTDPDSTPGNGFMSGTDDEASISIRTK